MMFCGVIMIFRVYCPPHAVKVPEFLVVHLLCMNNAAIVVAKEDVYLHAFVLCFFRFWQSLQEHKRMWLTVASLRLLVQNGVVSESDSARLHHSTCSAFHSLLTLCFSSTTRILGGSGFFIIYT
ncbi:unnamed protein product [Ectocarpus fasciculatus]